MINLLQRIVNKKIDRALVHYPKIKPENIKAGICRYNFMCHKNSVHDALNEPDLAVVVCYVHGEGIKNGYIHFLNWDLSDDTYIDNTLGNWKPNGEVTFLDLVPTTDYGKVDALLGYWKKAVLKKIGLLLYLIISNESI